MTKSRQPSVSFNERTKREMIEEYLKGGTNKTQIWRKYTGRSKEHGKIVQWMHQLGYLSAKVPSKPISLLPMPASNNQQPSIEELQQRIKQLEQGLLDSQLKEEAYRRMVDLAEKELKLSIKKKSDTK